MGICRDLPVAMKRERVWLYPLTRYVVPPGGEWSAQLPVCHPCSRTQPHAHHTRGALSQCVRTYDEFCAVSWCVCVELRMRSVHLSHHRYILVYEYEYVCAECMMLYRTTDCKSSHILGTGVGETPLENENTYRLHFSLLTFSLCTVKGGNRRSSHRLNS